MNDLAKTQTQDIISRRITWLENDLVKAKEEAKLFRATPVLYLGCQQKIKRLESDIKELRKAYEKLN